MKVVLWSKTNNTNLQQIFPPLLLYPPFTCARALLCNAESQTNVQILKKTTVLCPSMSYYSIPHLQFIVIYCTLSYKVSKRAGDMSWFFVIDCIWVTWFTGKKILWIQISLNFFCFLFYVYGPTVKTEPPHGRDHLQYFFRWKY